jgi:ribosome-associated protein
MDDTPNNSMISMTSVEFNKDAVALASLLAEAGLQDVLVLDVADLTSYANVVVIGTYTSDVQAWAFLQEAKHFLLDHHYKLQTQQRQDQNRWYLLDAYDIVLHIFSAEAREFYDLESVWCKAPLLYGMARGE